jgi:glucokinase
VSLGRKTEAGGLDIIALGESRDSVGVPWPRMLELLLADLETLSRGCPEQPVAIGISCGGPLDQKRGVILSPPNLPGWDEVPVTKFFREKADIPAFLQNDADAGALAEWKWGAGRGYNSLVFITFGTGCGAGLILNGRLYSGASGQAGEIGHVRLADYGPTGYGKPGSMEGFCSGGGIARLARAMAESELQMGKTPALCPTYHDLGKLTAKTVSIAAEQGDSLAISVYAEAGRKLGMGLSILMDILNPELIIIGSIFTRSRNQLWPEAARIIERDALPLARKACQVVPSALGESIGNYAALAVAEYGG